MLKSLACVLRLACPLWIAGAIGLSGAVEGQRPDDLRNLQGLGFVLADDVGDGHPDRILARIVIPHAPSLVQTTAGANLAARLGFESVSTDLGLVMEAGSRDHGAARAAGTFPFLLVGDLEGDLISALAPLRLTPAAARSDLVAGEGMILTLPPSPVLPAGGIWVTGADDTGLLAAANYLAARPPAVWMPDGPTWQTLGERVQGVIPDGEVHLDRLVVGVGRAGVLRARARVKIADADARAGAMEALTGDSAATDVLVAGLHRLDILLTGAAGEGEERVRLEPAKVWQEGSLRGWQPRSLSDFALSDLYTLRGIYRDSQQDLLPDRTEVHLSLGGTPATLGPLAARGLADVATRIAHEATGVRFPLVHLAGEETPPAALGPPLLFGVDHVGILRLEEAGRLPFPRRAGAGFFSLAKSGDHDGDTDRSLVLTGGDEAGLAAAASFVARHLPSLEPHTPGAFGLADVEEDLRRFFQARSVGGQVALALVKLDQWIARLHAGERPGLPPSSSQGATSADAPGWRPGTAIEALRIELAVDSVPLGLETFIRERVEAMLPGHPVTISLQASGFGAGLPVLDLARTFPWEVDEVWERLRSEVFPALSSATRRGRIEVRVSEPPEIRAALRGAIQDSIAARGVAAADFEVHVLSAYKQGYGWINDVVIPELAAMAMASPDGGSTSRRIQIDYRHLADDPSLRWQVTESPTRWLQELFPIEEVLARQLGIADTSVVFRGVSDPEGQAPVYRFRAWNDAGDLLLDRTLDPRYRIAPYFALHPDYERVRVATGWLRAEVQGAVLVDEAVATDLDRFWDFWQGDVQPALRDYLMDLHEGRISSANAPFFDVLDVAVRLSEPNHRTGVDEEVISSLESLHNDLYFNSIAFFSHLGEHYGVGPLNYPGRILPQIDPTGAGLPGEARVQLIGRAAPAAELALHVRHGGDTGRWRYPLTPLPTEEPRIRGIEVEARDHTEAEAPRAPAMAIEISALHVAVVALDSLNRYDEYRDQGSEGQVDRAFLSTPMLEGMVEAVRDLHGAHILEQTLSFQGIGGLTFAFEVARAPRFQQTHAPLLRSASPHPARHPTLEAAAFDWQAARRTAEAGGASMVQWDTPISPPESDRLLARLGAFPEVHAYAVGRSFLGRPLWAADFLPVMGGELRSRAKLTALRPTVFLSGRQHANEVSSTSHLLRLGEALVTDPEMRKLLNRVNVVLNPILNADGAQLAYDMQKVNPDFTLHAGYLGALGVDVTTGGGRDAIYPESRVRPAIMEAWLPDAFLNLHGYPSHEWVQHFSGYAAWVRGRTTVQRSWWAPRGWFIPGFSWVDDPDHPEIGEAQFAILDVLAESIASLPDIVALNARQYGRYARYGRQDVEGFREGFRSGMLTYLSLRGRLATGQGPMNPRILTFSATTEAPDETARGAWLDLVASAGLAHTSALVRAMAAGDPRVERKAEAFDAGVSRTMARRRPVVFPGKD